MSTPEDPFDDLPHQGDLEMTTTVGADANYSPTKKKPGRGFWAWCAKHKLQIGIISAVVLVCVVGTAVGASCGSGHCDGGGGDDPDNAVAGGGDQDVSNEGGLGSISPSSSSSSSSESGGGVEETTPGAFPPDPPGTMSTVFQTSLIPALILSTPGARENVQLQFPQKRMDFLFVGGGREEKRDAVMAPLGMPFAIEATSFRCNQMLFSGNGTTNNTARNDTNSSSNSVSTNESSTTTTTTTTQNVTSLFHAPGVSDTHPQPGTAPSSQQTQAPECVEGMRKFMYGYIHPSGDLLTVCTLLEEELQLFNYTVYYALDALPHRCAQVWFNSTHCHGAATNVSEGLEDQRESILQEALSVAKQLRNFTFLERNETNSSVEHPGSVYSNNSLDRDVNEDGSWVDHWKSEIPFQPGQQTMVLFGNETFKVSPLRKERPTGTIGDIDALAFVYEALTTVYYTNQSNANTTNATTTQDFPFRWTKLQAATPPAPNFADEERNTTGTNQSNINRRAMAKQADGTEFTCPEIQWQTDSKRSSFTGAASMLSPYYNLWPGGSHKNPNKNKDTPAPAPSSEPPAVCCSEAVSGCPKCESDTPVDLAGFQSHSVEAATQHAVWMKAVTHDPAMNMSLQSPFPLQFRHAVSRLEQSLPGGVTKYTVPTSGTSECLDTDDATCGYRWDIVRTPELDLFWYRYTMVFNGELLKDDEGGKPGWMMPAGPYYIRVVRFKQFYRYRMLYMQSTREQVVADQKYFGTGTIKQKLRFYEATVPVTTSAASAASVAASQERRAFAEQNNDFPNRVETLMTNSTAGTLLEAGLNGPLNEASLAEQDFTAKLQYVVDGLVALFSGVKGNNKKCVAFYPESLLLGASPTSLSLHAGTLHSYDTVADADANVSPAGTADSQYQCTDDTIRSFALGLVPSALECKQGPSSGCCAELRYDSSTGASFCLMWHKPNATGEPSKLETGAWLVDFDLGGAGAVPTVNTGSQYTHDGALAKLTATDTGGVQMEQTVCPWAASCSVSNALPCRERGMPSCLTLEGTEKEFVDALAPSLHALQKKTLSGCPVTITSGTQVPDANAGASGACTGWNGKSLVLQSTSCLDSAITALTGTLPDFGQGGFSITSVCPSGVTYTDSTNGITYCRPTAVDTLNWKAFSLDVCFGFVPAPTKKSQILATSQPETPAPPKYNPAKLPSHLKLPPADIRCKFRKVLQDTEMWGAKKTEVLSDEETILTGSFTSEATRNMESTTQQSSTRRGMKSQWGFDVEVDSVPTSPPAGPGTWGGEKTRESEIKESFLSWVQTVSVRVPIITAWCIPTPIIVPFCIDAWFAANMKMEASYKEISIGSSAVFTVRGQFTVWIIRAGIQVDAFIYDVKIGVLFPIEFPFSENADNTITIANLCMVKHLHFKAVAVSATLYVEFICWFRIKIKCCVRIKVSWRYCGYRQTFPLFALVDKKWEEKQCMPINVPIPSSLDGKTCSTIDSFSCNQKAVCLENAQNPVQSISWKLGVRDAASQCEDAIRRLQAQNVVSGTWNNNRFGTDGTINNAVHHSLFAAALAKSFHSEIYGCGARCAYEKAWAFIDAREQQTDPATTACAETEHQRMDRINNRKGLDVWMSLVYVTCGSRVAGNCVVRFEITPTATQVALAMQHGAIPNAVYSPTGNCPSGTTCDALLYVRQGE